MTTSKNFSQAFNAIMTLVANIETHRADFSASGEHSGDLHDQQLEYQMNYLGQVLPKHLNLIDSPKELLLLLQEKELHGMQHKATLERLAMLTERPELRQLAANWEKKPFKQNREAFEFFASFLSKKDNCDELIALWQSKSLTEIGEEIRLLSIEPVNVC
jgi:hypothetical protein